MLTGNSIGVDYHQGGVQISVIDEEGRKCVQRWCANDVRDVMVKASRHGPVKGVAIEACTGSAKFAEELRTRTGWAVKLCHPGYVQRMKNNPDKSDKNDSELLADLFRVGYLPEVWLASPEVRDLRYLVRYREEVMMAARNAKLRIRALLRNERIRPTLSLWTIAGIRWLKDLKDLAPHSRWVLSELVTELIRQTQKLYECAKIFKQVAKGDRLIKFLICQKGIGLVSAVVLRAEIGTFTRFRTGKQLSRFCGVTPCNRSSGERQADAGLIKAGNPVLKRCLIQIGHTLCRFAPRWKEMARKLSSLGKPYGVIVAAVVNRWLRGFLHTAKAFEALPS